MHILINCRGGIMKKVFFLVIILLLLLNCEKKPADEFVEAAGLNYTNNKILVVNSYHAELAGVIAKNKSLIANLNAAGIEYKIIYMDTKRNTSEEFKLNAALDAKEVIEEYKPDVVITFDDNAFKYLIMPYYRDADLPVVFVGIDWDVSIYDAPYSNTTGMISVALVSQLIEHLKVYTDGERIAWLGYDTFTARKVTKAYEEILDIDMSIHYVTNFEEWKSTFLLLQTEADMIIHSAILASMEDWDDEKAEEFVLENIKVPIGAVNNLVMNCSVLGLVKVLGEQGEWAVRTALEIINGKAPSDIPVTQNKQGEIIVNLDLAEKLDIAFSAEILKNAQIYLKE
jgi:ABC-type uncharacterized transport system substrate-binding protein